MYSYLEFLAPNLLLKLKNVQRSNSVKIRHEHVLGKFIFVTFAT